PSRSPCGGGTASPSWSSSRSAASTSPRSSACPAARGGRPATAPPGASAPPTGRPPRPPSTTGSRCRLLRAPPRRRRTEHSVGIFGRRKATAAPEPEQVEAVTETAPPGEPGVDRDWERRFDGPYDVSERPDIEGRVDLGALRVPAVRGMELR